ncbi:MAG: outer membrane lipoprotein-sorting protein [Myxococcaceae bacterium]
MMVLLSMLLGAVAQAKSVDEILAGGTPQEQGRLLAGELGARNAGYHDLSADVEMVLSDASGSEAKRAFHLKVLERPAPTEGDRSLIVFDSPADVKGTAVLSHAQVDADDEQWVYLPQSRRTKRVSGSNRTGAFLGSEFTFEDLTGNDGRKYEWTAGARKACGDSNCVELTAVPKDPESGYSKRVLLVDATELRIHSIAFYDRRGALLKTLTYGDYHKLSGRFWRSHQWTMKNEQTGKSTVLRFVGMKLSSGLTASDFASAKLGG